MADNLADSHCTNDALAIAIDGTRKMKLESSIMDDTQQKIYNQLRDNNFYENVFSWDMKNVSTNSENVILEFKTIDKFRKSLQKQMEMVTFENGMEIFNLYK